MRNQTPPALQIPGPFTVLQGVPGDGLCDTMDTPPELLQDQDEDACIQQWRQTMAQTAANERDAWRNQMKHNETTVHKSVNPRPLLPEMNHWWINDGFLNLYAEMPLDTATVVGSLYPGSSVLVQSVTTQKLPSRKMTEPSNAPPQPGTVQFALLLYRESFYYAVYSFHGYPYLAPGHALDYLDTYRVTCLAGAYVRSGPDLTSALVTTLPYGSLVSIQSQCIAHGLMRLQLSTGNGSTGDKSSGWISRQLNAQSGQAGYIVQPLPWGVPVVFDILLPQGAVVRQGVELSSAHVATVKEPVVVTQRAYSQEESTIQLVRYRTAAGWISQRLSSDDKRLVCQPAREVEDYDPTSGTFAYQQAIERAKHAPAAPPPRRPNDELSCMICLTESRTATLIHGSTGHICCCLACARILHSRQDPCPVCRLRIERVIQHFYA